MPKYGYIVRRPAYQATGGQGYRGVANSGLVGGGAQVVPAAGNPNPPTFGIGRASNLATGLWTGRVDEGTVNFYRTVKRILARLNTSRLMRGLSPVEWRGMNDEQKRTILRMAAGGGVETQEEGV